MAMTESKCEVQNLINTSQLQLDGPNLFDKPNITDSPVDPYEGMTDNEKNRMIYENKFNNHLGFWSS